MSGLRWLVDKETEMLVPVVNPATGLNCRGISQDNDGKYWFWDETQTSACGPFNTLSEVKRELNNYVKWLTKGPTVS